MANKSPDRPIFHEVEVLRNKMKKLHGTGKFDDVKAILVDTNDLIKEAYRIDATLMTEESRFLVFFVVEMQEIIIHEITEVPPKKEK